MEKPVGKSQYWGVQYHKHQKNKWVAKIKVKRKTITVGSFATELEAARAHDKEAKKYHGTKIKLNFHD